MTRHTDDEAAAVELRRRAEQRQAERRASRGDEPDEVDLRRLHHELEVHRIELEMQNDELRQARDHAEQLSKKYSDLYEFAPVGYFTLDRDGTVLEANLAGARLLRVERGRLKGQRLGSFVREADRPAFATYLASAFAGEATALRQVALESEGPAPLVVRIDALVSDDGRECRAAVLDITERVLAETRQDELIDELHKAIEHVKLLSGLLPICAACKRIRDDQGQWIAVEVFVRDHSDANFSHDICPDCSKKLYSEFA